MIKRALAVCLVVLLCLSLSGLSPTQILGAREAGLEGPIGDFFTEPFIIVYGGNETNMARELANMLGQQMGEEIELRADGDLSAEDVENNLLLFGTPGSNAVLSEVIGELPISIENETLTLSDQVFSGPDISLVMLCPNPLNEERYVLLFIGLGEEGLKDLVSDRHRFSERVDFIVSDRYRWRSLGYFSKDTERWSIDWDRTLVADKVKAWHGASLRMSKEGVTVSKVKEGLPAWEADLREGDVVKKIDTYTIDNMGDVKNATAGWKPGDTVTFFINRDGKPYTKTLTLVECYYYDGGKSVPYVRKSDPYSVLHQHPNVITGFYSKSKNVGEDLAKTLNGQFFYDVNFLGDYGDVVLVGEPYSNAYIVNLEKGGKTQVVITDECPGDSVGVVEFLDGIGNFHSVTIVSGSNVEGVKNAIKYVERVYSGEVKAAGNVTFVGSNGEKLNISVKREAIDEERASVLMSKVVGSMMLENEVIVKEIEGLRDDNDQLEKKVKDTEDEEKLAMAFLRYQTMGPQPPITEPPQGIAMPLILADMLSPQLTDTAIKVYQGDGSVQNLADFDKENLIHISRCYNGTPWSTTEEFRGNRKASAWEMFGFSEYTGKVAGDCYSNACFNTALLRLDGLPPDEVYRISMGGANPGEGHSINLVRNERTQILDSTACPECYPLFDHYGNRIEWIYFRVAVNDEHYLWCYDTSNIPQTEIDAIQEDVFALINKMLYTPVEYQTDEHVVEGGLRLSVKDVIPSPIVSDGVEGDVNVNFNEAKETLRGSAAELLAQKVYNFVLQQALEHPESQYAYARYAAGLMDVKKPQAYAYATTLAWLTEDAAHRMDKEMPQEDVNATIRYLQKIGPHEGFEDCFSFPDYLIITEAGCPRDKALLAYGLLRNMRYGEECWNETNLYVVVVGDGAYLAYRYEDGGWNFIDCATNELVEEMTPGIVMLFNEDSCYFPKLGVGEPIEWVA